MYTRHERDRAERQVQLARERDRDEGDGGERAPGVRGPPALGRAGALVGEEREGKEDGDPAEEVGAALAEPVRGDRERQAADRSSGGRHFEQAQASRR